jgi:hypothetical protein
MLYLLPSLVLTIPVVYFTGPMEVWRFLAYYCCTNIGFSLLEVFAQMSKHKSLNERVKATNIDVEPSPKVDDTSNVSAINEVTGNITMISEDTKCE